MLQATQRSTLSTNEHIERLYDEAASYYQQLRWFKTRLTRLEYAQTEQALLSSFKISSNRQYVEIGCGPGTWTKVVAQRAQAVVALDISANMIEQARAYVGTSGQVSFIHVDAAKFTPDQEFDGMFSFRVLEYVEGWQEALCHIAQSISVDGQAVICTKTPFSVYRGTGRERWFTAGVRHVLGKWKRQVLHQPEPHKDFEFYQKYIAPHDLQHVLESAGFTNFRVMPAIFGLPIFARGTCQYPIVPQFAEPLFMGLFERTRVFVTNGPRWLCRLALVFSESYVISATKQ